jgi:hypothetical protein
VFKVLNAHFESLGTGLTQRRKFKNRHCTLLIFENKKSQRKTALTVAPLRCGQDSRTTEIYLFAVLPNPVLKNPKHAQNPKPKPKPQSLTLTAPAANASHDHDICIALRLREGTRNADAVAPASIPFTKALRKETK